MIKKMLVNATHPGENRVAIVADGVLSELDIEIAGREQTKGNIYKAVVVRVETGLQAAFVDYGAERLGFLQMGDIHPKYYPERNEEKSRPRIGDILQRGQELLVQVLKEERGTKGAALTTSISLAGRYMVLMPDDDTRGISRKIPDGGERKSLRQAVDALKLPDGTGYIIRTAALGQSQIELQRDLDYLLRVNGNIDSLSKQVKAPALVYQESSLIIRSIRDYFSPDFDEILIDEPTVFQEAKDFIKQVIPDALRLIKLHQERRPIFSKYQIEDQIETINRNQVPLPSGGSIVIDTTEALVAIDVNSGKMASEKGIEATAFKTDLEAAAEVARQLRLRDLGGLVVIDFIDMRDRKHIRAVEKELKDALKGDKARVTVGRISQFGLLEMSRQRIKAALTSGTYNNCTHCNGSGRVKSTEAQAVSVLRKIHGGIAKGQIGRVIADVPAEVAEYLLNERREELHDYERRYQVSIYLRGKTGLIADQVELELLKREKEEKVNATETATPVTASAAIAEGQAAERKQATHEDEPVEATDQQPHPQAKKRRRSRGRRRRSNQEESPSADNRANGTGGDEASNKSTTKPADGETGTEEVAGSSAPAENGLAQPEESTADVTAAEAKPRSRRRGRRRKPATQSEQAEVDPADGQATATPVVDTAPPAETGQKESGPAEKPKRTRRPRKKPAVTEEVATTAKGDTPERVLTTAEPANTQTEPPQTEEAPAVEKPKRTRRTRKKPAAVVEEAVPEQASPAQAVTVPPTEPVTNLTEPVAAEKPKRTRRPRKKPAAVAENTAPEQTATAKTEPPTDPSESKVDSSTSEKATATEKPKRTRRPRKKTVTTEPDNVPQKSAASETAEPTGTAAAAKEEQPVAKVKPKRTRKSRSKPTEQAATEGRATATASAATEAAAATKESGTADKPKRTRKPAAKKSVGKAKTGSSETATESPTEAAPKRQPGRPRKKAAPTEETPIGTASSPTTPTKTEATEPEKKKPVRRTRKKAVAKPAPEAE